MYARETFGIVDVEASGLSSHSYPIEIGLVLPTGQQYQTLIQPIADWQHWDDSAEQLHGITREQLLAYGRDIKTVCQEINILCAGQTLYSDCWVYDHVWIKQLFNAAGVAQSFNCSPIEAILDEVQMERYYACNAAVQEELQVRKHRALNDALIIQKTLATLKRTAKLEANLDKGLGVLEGELSDSLFSGKASPQSARAGGYCSN